MDKILELCDVFIKDAATLSPEEFTNIRRKTLGASDASVVLGISKWSSETELLKSKLATELTPEEENIGQKPNVRKGRDLEPLILKKAEEDLKHTIIKYPDMLVLKQAPYLSINFDGIITDDTEVIPVEAKLVSMFAEKYWDKSCSGVDKTPAPVGLNALKKDEPVCGIPNYYYAQVQQELLGTGSNYAILSALFDKTWEMFYFIIPKDEEVQQAIIDNGLVIINRINNIKGSY